MIAPATQPSENPWDIPMPISASPMVAIVAHELPVVTDTNMVIRHVDARKKSGWSIFIP